MKTSIKPNIYSGHECLNDFKLFIKNNNYSSIAVLVDENTQIHCLPLLKNIFSGAHIIPTKSGERNKSIQSCQKVWKQLSDLHFDRKALVVNVGGGVLCDMGGFIAATYMRGIDFVHIPTTLLSMCDSCIGGKLSVNMDGLKNQIGLFSPPCAIVIYPEFLETLPEKQILSGFAEVIKHALVADKRFFKELLLLTDFKNNLDKTIFHSIKIKTRLVNLDIFETGIRKSLNFGHSIGHAIETYSIIKDNDNPISHGEAIAAGMIAASWISYRRNLLTLNELSQISDYILRFFPKLKINEEIIPVIMENIKKDKKNEYDHILFTLLDGIGQFRVNQEVKREEILQALKYYISL